MVRVFEHAFLCGWAHVWVRKFARYSSPYVLEATARFSTGMAATQSEKAPSCVVNGRFNDRIGDCIIFAYCW